MSFEVRPSAGAPEATIRELERALGTLSSPRLLVLFACGAVARNLGELGIALARNVPSAAPIVLASGSAVLSERGEVRGDGVGALTGLLIGGGKPAVAHAAEDAGDLAALFDAPGPALLAVRSEQVSPDALDLPHSGPILGVGALGDPGLVLVEAGRARAVAAVRVPLPAALCPSVRVAHGARLLGELFPVSAARGNQILELGGKPALARLGESARELEQRTPLLVAFARGEPSSPEHWVVRPIVGVDPDRGGIFVGPEATRYTHAGFAVRDPVRARTNLETGCRALKRELHGAAPRCGLYFSSGTRGGSGSGLEVRTIAEAFPGMPFAGMHGAFQLGPLGPGTAAQLHAGVLGVLRRPS